MQHSSIIADVSTLRLYFLGPPRFARDDYPVELTVAKAVALLAYLAVTRKPQTRDRLLGLFWPESPADAARKNLRNTLWSIRKALGDHVVRADDDRLALHESVWVDLHEFEELTDFRQSKIQNLNSKIDLYRGPFLDGLNLNDAPEFEIWLMTERERLGQLYLRALAALVDRHRAEGQWQEVSAIASRALVYDNLQEPMYRALMEAHARLGERPEALRLYDTLRTTLDRELGVEPLPETEALRAAIVSGDLQPPLPSQVWGGTRDLRDDSPLELGPIGGARPKRRGGPAGATRVPFIGRHAERAVLDAEFQVAATGHARVVLLTGEVGIGKSRLWQEWSAGLAPEVTVLATRCIEATQALPFMPLIELFSSQVCAQRLASPTPPVASIWLAEIARLMPEIRVNRPDLPALPVLPPEEERIRVFEGFAQLLLGLSAQPLVLFVDDLHWADHATLAWLGYLLRRLRDQPLLLVGAYRPEDAPASLVNLVTNWGREGVARRLALPRLTNEEAAALIASLGVDPRLVHRVQAQSAGIPYFLVELSRAGLGDLVTGTESALSPGPSLRSGPALERSESTVEEHPVPPPLADLIRVRLDRLPDTARQVLQAAAILEPGFDFTTLRRTSGRGEEETLDALDTLLNAAVLVERNAEYAFSHPLVAAVVRGNLSSARRAFLHRRAAEALEATHTGRLPQIAGQLAAHYGQAGQLEPAARYAEMAAERALTLAAPDEAVGFYRQALAFDPSPSRQMGLGRALLRQGDLVAARAAFESALGGFEAKGDRQSAARACNSIAETYFPAGRFDEAVRWMEKSLAYLDPGADPVAHAFTHLFLGAGQLDAGQSLAQAERHLIEAARLATENNVAEVAARSHFVLGNLLAERGDLGGALRAFGDSIAFAQAAGEHYQEVLGHNNLAYHALLIGDLATAREHVETGLALAEARALRLPLQYLYSTRGEIALAGQRWDEAEDWFKRGLAEAERNGNLQQAANYRANLGLAARGRGDLDSALLLLEAARDSVATSTARHLQLQIDLWLAELYLERGERAAAAEALTRAEARLAGSERRRLQAWAEQLRQELTKRSRPS